MDSPAVWALNHGHHALHSLSRNWLEEVLPMLGQHAQPIHGTLPQAAVLSLGVLEEQGADGRAKLCRSCRAQMREFGSCLPYAG